MRRTALHWSCKQGHTNLVKCLLQNGADANIRTDKGELPASLTDKDDILDLLPRLEEPRVHQEPLPIVPHFMINPPFPYKDMTGENAGLLAGGHLYKTRDDACCVADELSSMTLGRQQKSNVDQGLEGVNGCRADVQLGLCTDSEKGR